MSDIIVPLYPQSRSSVDPCSVDPRGKDRLKVVEFPARLSNKATNQINQCFNLITSGMRDAAGCSAEEQAVAAKLYRKLEKHYSDALSSLGLRDMYSNEFGRVRSVLRPPHQIMHDLPLASFLVDIRGADDRFVALDLALRGERAPLNAMALNVLSIYEVEPPQHRSKLPSKINAVLSIFESGQKQYRFDFQSILSEAAFRELVGRIPEIPGKYMPPPPKWIKTEIERDLNQRQPHSWRNQQSDGIAIEVYNWHRQGSVASGLSVIAETSRGESRFTLDLDECGRLSCFKFF